MFGVPSRRRTAAILGSWAGAIAVLLAAALAVHGEDNKQDTKPDESRKAAALAAWDRIVTVLQHPRCMNCHQADVPLQGDERRIHIPLVVRGPDNHGIGAMRCGNCHNGSGNNETSGTPGAGGPELWQMAPLPMKWQGLSSGEICRALRDPTLNKKPGATEGRKGPDLVEHMDTEPLVRWAWDPVHNPPWDLDRDPSRDPDLGTRKPMPMSHQDFVKLMTIWTAAGMLCPD